MQVKKKQSETDKEQWMDSKLGKDYSKVVYCHPVYLTKIMASCPITSLQVDGETMERVTDLFSCLQNHCNHGDCKNETKRHLLLGRKAMTNLEIILKSRDITLPTKSKLCFLHLSCMDVSVGP